MKTQFRFAYILFAVTIAQGYSTENSENDRFKDSLQGRVKSYSEFFTIQRTASVRLKNLSCMMAFKRSITRRDIRLKRTSTIRHYPIKCEYYLISYYGRSFAHHHLLQFYPIAFALELFVLRPILSYRGEYAQILPNEFRSLLLPSIFE